MASNEYGNQPNPGIHVVQRTHGRMAKRVEGPPKTPFAQTAIREGSSWGKQVESLTRLGEHTESAD